MIRLFTQNIFNRAAGRIIYAGFIVALFLGLMMGIRPGAQAAPTGETQAVMPGAATTVSGTFSKINYVQENFPDTAGGIAQRNLYLGYETPNNKKRTRIHLQFNLPTLPARAEIASAEVVLGQYAARGGNLPVTAYRITTDWDSFATTWNNQPGKAEVVGRATFDGNNGIKRIDITNQVKQWYGGGRPNYGVTIWADNETDPAHIFCSGGSPAMCLNQPQPRLEVTYNILPLCETVTQIPQTECEALVDLYNSTDGPNWKNNSGWLSDNTPCNWFGVACGGGTVTSLDLSGDSQEKNQLRGNIPPELGNLSNLQRLDLKWNDLSGNIPPELGNLADLIYLSLTANQLNGNIPPELANLSNLEWLDLSANQLSGSIPPELGNLSNLTHLYLYDNQLSESIPPELGNLSNLTWFYSYNNQLSGNIPPELGNLSNLTHISLSANQLNGNIPPELGNLSDLKMLHLHANQLNGNIPPELGNLSNLEALSLGSNQLSGNIPSELGNLSKLEFLHLYINQLSGNIPSALGNLSNLTEFHIYINQLNGNIPPELGNLSNLTGFSLGANQLSGNIPSTLGNLSKLETLYLDINQLSGNIPSALGNLSNLTQLQLSDNQLSGSIPPELGNLSNLKWLDLNANQLSGDIPAELTQLTTLSPDNTDLGYNKLTASNPVVTAFLDTKDPDWDQTQTIPPAGLQAEVQSGSSVTLTWTPIPYTADGGFYEVSYAADPGGPYTVHGTTADKSAASYTVDGLASETTSYFRLRTHTPAHDGQQNDLWSAYTPPTRPVDSIKPPPLQLTQTVSPTVVRPGDAVTYQVNLAVREALTTAHLTATLPAGVTFDSASEGGIHRNGQILFDLSNLPAGTGVTVTYRAIVDSNVPRGSILFDEALVVTAGDAVFEAPVAAAVADPNFTGDLMLIYTAGDNDLAKYVQDLVNRAERVGSTDRVKTWLVVDGPATGDSYLYFLQPDSNNQCLDFYGDPDCGGRYEEGQTMWRFNENVGNPYALAEFIKGALLAHPQAGKTLLSLVGHGGGWSPEVLGGQPSRKGGQSGRSGSVDDQTRQIMGGLLWDEYPADSLSTADLADALQWGLQAGGRDRLDLLYLDACLMAMSEVAYEVQDSAAYLLASESWSWTSFAYDAHLRVLDDEADLTTEAIGRAWLENEVVAMTEDDGYPFTYSLIDLEQMDALMTAENDLAQALTAALPGAKDKIDAAFEEAACFDSDQDGLIRHNETLGWDDNYCDLASFALALADEFDGQTAAAANAVSEAVARTVIKEDHQAGIPWGHSDQTWTWVELGGLSKYTPLITDDWKRAYYAQKHLPSLADSAWDEFLTAYWNDQPPPEDPCSLDPVQCEIPPAPMPLAPIGLKAEAGLDTIFISWQLKKAVPNLAGYRLERRAENGDFQTIATDLAPAETQYPDADSAMQKDNRYCYRVRALNRAGQVIEAVQSPEACARLGELVLWMPEWSVPPQAKDVLVPINLRNGDGLCVGSMDIAVGYDSTIVQATPNVLSLLFNANDIDVNTGNPGRIGIAAAGLSCSQVAGTERLFEVGFDVVGQENQITPLDFITGPPGTTIGDEADKELTLKLENGSLRVENQHIRGDIDGNGVITSLDARLAMRFGIEAINLTRPQRQACDVTGDGVCDVGDGIVIRCYVPHQDWNFCLDPDRLPGPTSQLTAAQNNVVRLAIAPVAGQPGQPITLPVAISNGPELAGGIFTFIYDSQTMRFQDASLTALTGDYLLVSNVIEPGLLRVALASNTPINADGDIFQLEFERLGQASPVTFGDFRLYDAAGREFRRDLKKEVEIGPGEPGSITIIKTTRPPGGTGFVFGGDLGQFTLADGGSYSQTNLAAGTYRVFEQKVPAPDPTLEALLLARCVDQNANAFPPEKTETNDHFEVDIPLAGGQHLTCTFHNEWATVEKEYDLYLPWIIK